MNDSRRICLDLLTRHLLVTRHMSPSTRRSYTSDIKAWIGWCTIREINPTEITPERVALWLSFMAHNGRTLTTIQRRAAAVSTWAKILNPEGKRVADTAIARHALNANDSVMPE